MFNRLLFILLIVPVVSFSQIPNHGMYNLLRDVVYECTLTQSVIAAYDFEETSGTTLIDETAIHNGTLAASGVTINQTGNPGQAHNFQSGYHTVADHDNFTFDNNFSVSCWVNFDAIGANNYIANKTGEWLLFLSSTNHFIMRFYNLGTTSYFQVYTNATFSAGTNYHVVFNVPDWNTEFGGYEIWVNGVEQAFTTNNNPVTLSNTSSSLNVGGGAGFGYLDGELSQLIIRDKSLSEAEILEEYNSGAGEQYDNFCNGSSPVYYTTTVTESYINDANSGNSGSVSPGSKDFLSGASVTLASEFTNSGANFDGFYWNSNGTSPVTSFTITQDTTVYAVYDYTSTPEPSSTFFASGDYYVRDDASGSGNGTDSLTNAWTFAQFEAAASSLVAGDTVVFCHDDVFNGGISVNVSGTSGNPIVIGAYGSGARPKFYGSEVVSSWTLHSGNIYKATVTSDVEQVFIDGNRATLARWPNSGWMDITGVVTTGGYFVTSSEINAASDDYTSSTVFFRTTAYTMYAVDVLSTTAGRYIEMESSPFGDYNAGEGMILTNKLLFLDSPGEWYYDTGTNTLYAWMPGNDSPTNYEVRAATTAAGVTINPLKSAGGRNYVNIEHLELKQFGVYGIYAYASDYVTIKDVVINEPDFIGIAAYEGSCDYLTVENSTIDGANSNGIRVNGTYSNISGNSILNIGLLDNLNKRTVDGDNFGTAIYSRLDNPTIEYNYLNNINYDGINWKGTNGSIKYNLIANSCLVLDDGAAIYTYDGNTSGLASNGSVVDNNIIINAYGNREGYTKGYEDGYGIYMDGYIKNVTISDNIVWGTTGCIFLNLGGANTVTGNTMANAIVGLYSRNGSAASTAENNLFVACDTAITWKYWQSDKRQRPVYQEYNIAAMDYNHFRVPYTEPAFWVSGANATFTTYKSSTGQDASSTYDGTDIVAGGTTELFYNHTGTIKTFYLNGATNVEDAYGTSITTSFTVPAYSGRIMLGNNLNLISE